MTLSGQIIGPYRVEREIGRGGMATVYLCTVAGEPRPVALKVLHPHMAQDPMIVRRFKLEGENGAHLRHPNIVSVLDSGYAGGHYYLAMEYVDGGTLADLLKQRKQPLTIDAALPILRQVAEGLDYAHSLGILHRDVKPSNFMLGQDGRVLLTDFGVARQLAADHTVVTVAGFAVGTPAYMSPEQARGDLEMDRRSDVYSLGVVAYAVLTGQLPYDAPSQLVLLRKIIDDLPTMPEAYQPDLPGGVCYALRKVLAKDPARRYATASEFVAALDHGRRWKPTPLDLAAAEKAILAQPPTTVEVRATAGLPAVPKRSGRGGLLALAAAALLLAAAGAWYAAPEQVAGVLSQMGGGAPPPTAAAGADASSAGLPPTANRTPPSLPASGAGGAPTDAPTATLPSATPTPLVVSIMLAPFADEQERFSLNVPQGWAAVASDNGVRFTAPDTAVALFVYTLAGQPAIEDAQAALESFAAASAGLFPNLAGLQRLNLGDDGAYPAIRFETDAGTERAAVVQMVRVGAGERLFALGQHMDAEQAGRYGSLLPAVVGSFAVLPEPTPTTTPTPVPPTNTPTASPEPTGTFTLQPTSVPSATATAAPSNTVTRTPLPSATPAPTADAAATSTTEAQRIATSVAQALTAIPTVTPTTTRSPSATPTPDLGMTLTAVAAELTRLAPTMTPTASPSPSATPTPDLNMTLTAIAVELTRLAPTMTPTASPSPSATPTPDLNMTLTAIAVELTQIAPTPTPDLNMTLTAIAVELTQIATTPTPP